LRTWIWWATISLYQVFQRRKKEFEKWYKPPTEMKKVVGLPEMNRFLFAAEKGYDDV